MVVVMQGTYTVLHSHQMAAQLMCGRRLTAQVQVLHFTLLFLSKNPTTSGRLSSFFLYLFWNNMSLMLKHLISL